MATTPQNLLVLMSDEHNPKIAGYAGHPIIGTPALDTLAARGCRFTAAYTPSPICVPARASLATGLPVHRHRAWDNAIAYDGGIRGWAHALRERGHHVASIGKLHFRGHPEDDYGFTESLLPMHITDGIGDVTHLVRDPDDIRTTGKNLIASAGPGESSYTLYDRQVAATAQIWLRETGTRRHARPWVLFVSMVAPHFPLTAPPEHYYRYIGQHLRRPKLYDRAERPDHPYIRIYGRRSNYDEHFNGPTDLQRALAGYFGLVSFLDEQIGKILAVLFETGLAGTTRVIYTTDHGDNLGARGLWGKATMYEESAGIPMLVAGEGVPAATVCGTPVTLCDVSTTILDAVGASEAIEELRLPGTSLRGLASQPSIDRTVLSEFHTYGPDAFYMLRDLRHKFVYYVDAPPQLFDLQLDPEELTDLGTASSHARQRAVFEARLHSILDPELIDQEAKADQARMARQFGGFDMLRRREKVAFTPPPTSGAH